ncbi:MAG: M48 family metallopeptidase [Eubacterium sp.]|nr:M48 family metallopeptidase [Eubacterium sp.]
MEYKIIRSRRRSLALEIDKNAQLIVRAPYHFSSETIRRYVAENRDWIERHLAEMQARKEALADDSSKPLSPSELQRLADQALRQIPPRLAKYAAQMGVTYGRITIRNQRTRWGSCSANGNLNFNCLLMLAPPEVLDYVIVHELAHRKQMNHSALFWNEVETVLPDYRVRRKWLKDNGWALMARMPV